MSDDPSFAAPGGLRWAEPLVHDTLRQIYDGALGAGRAGAIARMHGDAWSRLLAGETVLANIPALERSIAAMGGDADLVHRANAAVATELADLIRRRFRVSPRTQESYRRPIAAAAERFAQKSRA